ncbi:MAG: molybdopterin biosynthesis protein [Planctomycetota bacterium]
MKQEQFLQVVSRAEAERRWRAAVDFAPLDAEPCPLEDALGRVLAEEVRAPVDVPGFTRANMDGFAVRAADTFGAAEEEPRLLRINDETVTPGVVPQGEVAPGTATPIATGAIVPRGADAVVMVEDTDPGPEGLEVRRAVAPGANLAHAGSDIARGETVLRPGDVCSSRETGLLAALGVATVEVVSRPRVVLFSTGDELLVPGQAIREGGVYDSNQRILADAVREAGGEPDERGIVRDDEAALRQRLAEALAEADLVLFSGGTSKGAGDLSYRILEERGTIAVHGVALKPGKPVVLAVAEKKPVVILPGFPTSAIFTFHEFVAPWIRARAGLAPDPVRTVAAVLPRTVTSDRGRTEYDLVHLVSRDDGLVAYPLGKGSGSVTTFSRADGFLAIPAADERVDAGESVSVTLLGPLRLADLVVIGSHCTGLDLLLSELRRRGFTSKIVAVGSQAGLEAAQRGECDVAGIHLLDPETDIWNEPFLTEGLRLVKGYGRRQGVVSRDGREEGRLVNRNRASGTRILIDRLLDGRRPDGYEMEVRSHQAVAAAVASGRADWGVCIENVARDLAFRFLAEERFDFVVPDARRERPAVRALIEILEAPETRARLAEEGFLP